MNFLSANTTNQRRLIMFIASGILGVVFLLVFYQAPFAVRVPIESGIMGLLVFEVMFRTRKWLSLSTLVLYAAAATIISQSLYSLLYGGFSFQALSGMLSVFPYNLYAVLEMSIVTGVAYYLIKVHRGAGWLTSETESVPEIDAEPVQDEPSLGFSAWIQKYNQQIMGFIGWYLIATVLSSGSAYGLITTPATVIALIGYARSKQSKGVAGGILIAVSLNFVVSLVRGLSLNAWCLIPFYNGIY